VGSISFIANLPGAERARLLEDVRGLVTGSAVELRYDCGAHLYRKH
jgi:hypothetical protein